MSPKSATQEPKAQTPVKTGEAEAPAEKYFKVVFNHKQNPNETQDVLLSVNGDQIVIKRGEEVVIPARYREVADHATYQTFTQAPGQDRKITGYVQVYPYILQGESTEAEFLKQLAAGNKLARDKELMRQESMQN